MSNEKVTRDEAYDVLVIAPGVVATEPVAWMHVQGNHFEPSLRQLDEDEKERGWTQFPLYGTDGVQEVPVADALQQADAFLALLRGLFLSNAPQLATEDDRRRLFDECVRIRTLIAVALGVTGTPTSPDAKSRTD